MVSLCWYSFLSMLALGPVVFSFEARAAPQEWEAQVCLMSQRIPPIAAEEDKKTLRKRDHRVTFFAQSRTDFSQDGRNKK